MRARQSELFEPTGAEVPKIAAAHLGWQQQHERKAEVFEARGMMGLAAWERQAAATHAECVCELAMLADFERLGGVAS